MTPSVAESWSRLTPRQRQVLYDRAQGYTRAQVAQRLGLAESTVRNHIWDALKKLPRGGSDPRSCMLWLAYQLGKEGLQP